MLFLEMFIVRWISTEIRIFAYISNLALLACFIGIGTGCYLTGKKINLRNSLIALCFLILASKSIPFRNITDMLSGFSDFAIWFENFAPNKLFPVIWGITLSLSIFAGIVIVFIPLGQILGSLLNTPQDIILAYSLNISASILGIWLFALLSFFSTPPFVWLILSLLLFIWFFIYNRETIMYGYLFSLFAIILIMSSSSNSIITKWSPYQRLDVYPNLITYDLQNGYIFTVNNANYMALLDLSPEFIERYPNLYNIGLRKFNQYEIPYMFTEQLKDVLIAGAGGGNDTAGALRSKAEHVDAVEIDPEIYRLGLYLHPERPYLNENVNIIIDDARSYFKRCTKKYDLISFGLADSHTLSSSYNNLRLDHYLYTLESFKETRLLLKDDGVLAVIFDAKRDWIAKRIYGVLKNAFQTDPITFQINSPYGQFGWGGIMYITGNNKAAITDKIDKDPGLKEFIDNNIIKFDNTDTLLTTDDWPYLYLRNRAIPVLHLCVSLILLILFISSGKILFFANHRVNLHFFFLGMAFLLLEFQNISKTCLLFGSTWLVNAYMISAILFLILLANTFVYYLKRINTHIVYLLLLCFIVIQYLVPLTIFNNLAYPLRGILPGLFLNTPVFFAGVIFIQSFKNTPDKSIAFGSNLLGAALGGILESVSFVTGIKSLLMLVLTFYLLSYLFVRIKA